MKKGWNLSGRWDSAAQSGTSWAGQELPAVQIDRFGRFAYVLVRLSDRLAGSKLLVRGHNGRTEEQLVSAVTREVRCSSQWRLGLRCGSWLLPSPREKH